MAGGLLNVVKFIWTHPIGSRRRARAFTDFVRWQLASRVLPGARVVDFAGTARLLVEPGMTGATGSIYVGLHEFEDMAFVVHALRKDDLFVDVGANVGTYTVLASTVSGAKSVSFEPIAETYDHFLDNVRLNGIGDRVRAVKSVVGSEPGSCRITSRLDTVNHVVTSPQSNGETVEVPCVTLDDALGGQPATVVKIDVEGFEQAVLQGATKTLSSETLMALIVELGGLDERYGYSANDTDALLRRHGFDLYRYDPFERKLSGPVTLDAVHGNALYLRSSRLEQVAERVKSAAPLIVKGLSI